MTVSVPSFLAFSYAGDGVTTSFVYGNFVHEAADLVVVLEDADGAQTVQKLNVDYTVTGVGGATANAVFGTAPVSGSTVRLYRATAKKQTVDLADSARNPAETTETQLDRIVRVTQDLGFETGRALKTPIGSSPIDDGHFLIMDQNGEVVSGGNASEVVNAQGYAEAAIQAAQEATDAKEAAEAAAAGVDLPPVSPDTMLVDNASGTAREAKTFPDVRSLLSVGPHVSNIALVKALETASETHAYLTQPGRAGAFSFRSGDFSSFVSADTAGGIYLEADDAAPTSGAWVRNYDGYINVRWFGVTGDGTTDDTAAIQAAIDFCESLITTFAFGGVTLFFPRGSYLITGTLTVAANHIVLRGEGKEASVIVASSPNFTFVSFDKAGSALYGGGVVEMAFQAGGNATAGTMIRMDDVLNGYIHNVVLRGWWNGIDLVGSNRVRLSDVELHQGTRSSGSGNDAIRLIGDATAGAASDIHMTDIQVLAQSAFSYSTGLKILGVDGLYVQNGHFIEGNRAVDFVPDGASGQNVIASAKFTNCYFDTATTNHVRFAGTASAYRSVGFVNCTFRQAGADSVQSVPDSQVTNVSFVGCNFRQNAFRAVYLTDGDLDQVLIVGCIFDGNNTANGANYGDVRCDGGSNLIVSACVFAGGGAAGTAVYFGASVSGAIFGQSDLTASTAGTKVNPAGTSIRMNSLRGFVLKNSGEATITNPNALVTVTHGLDVTPSAANIRVNLRNDAAGVTRFWVDNVTATTFRLNVNAAPTTSGTWAWEVDEER